LTASWSSRGFREPAGFKKPVKTILRGILKIPQLDNRKIPVKKENAL
jgi:hypothetical protein